MNINPILNVFFEYSGGVGFYLFTLSIMLIIMIFFAIIDDKII